MEPTDFIPTRGSLNKLKVEKSFKLVEFQSHKSKAKRLKDVDNNEEVGENQEVLDMKRARHEIIKYGTSGFDAKKKEEAKVQLAIRLGAKPPKNKYVNYKQLVKDRKADKEKLQKQISTLQLGKNTIGKSTAKGKSFDRKRRKEGLLDVYGTVKKSDLIKDKKVSRRK